MRKWILLAAALSWGCEQNIGATGPSSDRPSIVNACSEVPQGFASTPAPRKDHGDRQPIVVNVPRPEPTIRCDRTDARTGLSE